MPARTTQLVRSVVAFQNETKPEARRMMREVAALLRRQGAHVRVCRNRPGGRELLDADLAVAMGGDGTMLRAARALAPYSIPLLGINSGHLGFLTGTDLAGFRRSCRDILRGRFLIEERWMVSVEVVRGGRSPRRVFGPHLALNDCVIRCGDQARAILLTARSGARFVADYFGDGLIVATPTGSTAYALAASGPIVDPGLDVLLVAPICPHTLTQRPLIVSAGSPFTVGLTSRHPREAPHVVVSLDGQLGCALRIGDEVRVRRYDKPFRLVLDPGHSYFEVLRRKLRWGQT
ncbi:MAG: NAD(+)/NADH kinase [Elusimicrobia bacterium]|nr:NAD(+)/NADH kinase [Elusimicrobiota bacterium]